MKQCNLFMWVSETQIRTKPNVLQLNTCIPTTKHFGFVKKKIEQNFEMKLIFYFVLSSWVMYSTALQCYRYSHVRVPNGESLNISTVTTITCSSSETRCYRNNALWPTFMYRSGGCSDISFCSSPVVPSQETLDCCNTDLCNGASFVRVSLGLSAVVMALASWWLM